jgi:hypothetical protein
MKGLAFLATAALAQVPSRPPTWVMNRSTIIMCERALDDTRRPRLFLPVSAHRFP